MSDFDFPESEDKGKVIVEGSTNRGKTAAVSSTRTRKAEPSAILVEEDIMSKKDEDDNAKEKPVVKYDPQELTEIFDDIIFNGEYSEDVVIKNRLKVTFRTRTVEELSAISKLVDASGAVLIATVNEQRLVLNLQYALVTYQGNKLGNLKVEERAKFVSKLAGPIIALLSKALYEFDMKVQAACQEGEQNL